MAEFIKSASKPSDWINDGQVEVVLIGRSNVGKSSIINALANSKIAITSKTPGRTQLANFYDFKSFRLVDLPGYGYAKVQKDAQNQLIKIIDEVLMIRSNVYMTLHIVDANVITAEDLMMAEYLKKRFVHHYFIANKADKSSMKYYLSQKQKICKYLQIKNDELMFVSTKKQININQIKNLINATIKSVK